MGENSQPAAQTEQATAVQTAVELAIPSDILPRLLQTQAAYRDLVGRGFNGADAAGLIGYVVGLPACTSRWSLGQINRLLFLRNLYSNTAWGKTERRPN